MSTPPPSGDKRKQQSMTGEPSGGDHNPSFVTKVPWYLGREESDTKTESSGGNLDHQKNWRAAPSSSLASSIPASATGTVALAHQNDSCENCGQTGHVRRDCLERPRKVAAKFFEPDAARSATAVGEHKTHVPNGPTGFETKRDRWEGYDAEEYNKVVDDWRKKEMIEVRERVKKAAASATSAAADPAGPQGPAAPAHNMFAADETVANLRIREDRAKYLYNLDVNSAYYDPKSRSMRDDPRACATSTAEGGEGYKGDNFVRYSGDAQESMKARQFAWESAQRGDTNVHEVANPTESLLKMKKLEEREVEKISESQRRILEKYGALDESDDED